MSSHDWRWKIGEAIERIRTRYDYIGRKTGLRSSPWSIRLKPNWLS